MTRLDERRKRIVRIRSVEQRIAQQHLAEAQRCARQIQGIIDRIGALALENRVGEGATDGMALAALSDTRARLHSATRATLAPLRQALGTVEHRQAGNIQAQLKEKGARQLLEKAEREFEATNEARRSAGRCWTTTAEEEQ